MERISTKILSLAALAIGICGASGNEMTASEEQFDTGLKQLSALECTGNALNVLANKYTEAKEVTGMFGGQIKKTAELIQNNRLAIADLEDDLREQGMMVRTLADGHKTQPVGCVPFRNMFKSCFGGLTKFIFRK